MAQDASLIKLRVKQINGLDHIPFDRLFNIDDMVGTRAQGADTIFSERSGKEFLVDETFIEVLALIGNDQLTPVKEVWLTFDATGGRPIGIYDFVDGVTGAVFELPENAAILDGFASAEDSFTSASNAATIAIGAVTDFPLGLKAAVAINNVANPWSAGVVTPLIPIGTAATITPRTTAKRKIQATVGVQNLTGGVLNLFIRYIVFPT